MKDLKALGKDAVQRLVDAAGLELADQARVARGLGVATSGAKIINVGGDYVRGNKVNANAGILLPECLESSGW